MRAFVLLVPLILLWLPWAVPAQQRLLLDTAVDSVRVADSLAQADSLAAARGEIPRAQPGAPPQKLKLIRRAYNYREQLGLALGMMAFVLVIFTTTQNWNPD